MKKKSKLLSFCLNSTKGYKKIALTVITLSMVSSIQAIESEDIYAVKIGSISQETPVLNVLTESFSIIGQSAMLADLNARGVGDDEGDNYVLLLSLTDKLSKQEMKSLALVKAAKKYGIPIITEVGIQSDDKASRIKSLNVIAPAIPDGDVHLLMPGKREDRGEAGRPQSRLLSYEYSQNMKSVKRSDESSNEDLDSNNEDTDTPTQSRVENIANRIETRLIKRFDQSF